MDRRRRKILLWTIAGVVAVVLLLVLGHLRPAAPRSLDLLTGPKGSGYHQLGARYAEYLEQHGVRARVVVTKGAMDNLERLASGGAPAIGFAETGVEHELTDPADAKGLVSLGSLGFEPIWLFVRKDTHIMSMSDLRGRKIMLGPKGTGTRALADMLLEVNGLSGQVESDAFDAYSPEEIRGALRSGALDAVFLVAAPLSPLIQSMLRVEEAEAVPFTRAKAYAALYPEIARVVIPAGGLDLALDQPQEDLELVSGTTNLVARDGLHPAAIGLMLGAARSVHRQSDLMAPAGTFPSMDYTTLPLDDAAVNFFESGPSGLSRVLPYWLAALADQFIFVVLPALLGLLAVLKAVPTVLNLRFSYQTTKLYRRLADVEKRHGEEGARDELLAELAELDRTSADLKPPLSKLAPYFELRQNIHDVHDRVQDPDLG